MGEVLVRGFGPEVYSPPRRELVQECADRLALALENIRLVRCLNGNQLVKRAVQSVSQAAAPGVPHDRVFRHFAAEIKELVEFQRLRIYWVSQESDLAMCAYQTGQGMRRCRPGETLKLSDSGLGETAANGESRIFQDLSECARPVVWNQMTPTGMRSALLAPVLHHGIAVGMVLLEHRLPQAYGTVDQTCLEEIVAALSPSMAHLPSPIHLAGNRLEPAYQDVRRELASILGASLSMEEVFPPFVGTLDKVVPIDRAGISWIDPNGYDYRDLWASPATGILDPDLIPATGVPTGISIDTQLDFKEETIGTLTICRDRGKGFTIQEQTILVQMGVQISPVVQSNRLYVHAKRQAFQLQQLRKGEMLPDPVESLTSLTEALGDQTASIGQAEWYAVFMPDHQSLGPSTIADGIVHEQGSPKALTEEIEGLAAHCFEKGAPVRRSLPHRPEPAAVDQSPAKDQPTAFSQERSWECLALPLQNSVEKTGVLMLGRGEGFAWTKEEVCLLEAFVGEAANEIESARRKDAGNRTDSGKLESRLKPLHQELLAETSRSLRSPLTSIKGFSSTMLRQDISRSQERYREFLQIIERESDRLDRAVSDLLTPTQKELGAIALRPESLRIEDLFHQAHAKCALDADRHLVSFDYERTLPKVLVDPARMVQVITYLAKEVEQANPGCHPGCQRVTVDARWREGKPSVSIGLAEGGDAAANAASSRRHHRLRLEICRTLLSAHGQRLETVCPGLGTEVFQFFLTPAVEYQTAGQSNTT
ncbi:MAG: hypothetical protein BZY80_02810 [SAR202 cluster bacterium Io17-Chloro-G2]|nr:MAG: hypothetical protein BZY80_02810 [SAR202 cluster bacterium Io17-Chloro-G2]